MNLAKSMSNLVFLSLQSLLQSQWNVTPMWQESLRLLQENTQAFPTGQTLLHYHSRPQEFQQRSRQQWKFQHFTTDDHSYGQTFLILIQTHVVAIQSLSRSFLNLSEAPWHHRAARKKKKKKTTPLEESVSNYPRVWNSYCFHNRGPWHLSACGAPGEYSGLT